MSALAALLAQRRALEDVIAEHGGVDPLPVTRALLRDVEAAIEQAERSGLPRLTGGRPEVPPIPTKSSRASER